MARGPNGLRVLQFPPDQFSGFGSLEWKFTSDVEHDWKNLGIEDLEIHDLLERSEEIWERPLMGSRDIECYRGKKNGKLVMTEKTKFQLDLRDFSRIREGLETYAKLNAEQFMNRVGAHKNEAFCSVTPYEGHGMLSFAKKRTDNESMP